MKDHEIQTIVNKNLITWKSLNNYVKTWVIEQTFKSL
jgi:hypothetical protein